MHYSCFYDGKGNVEAVLDWERNVAAAYRYDPFGKLLAKTGALDQPFQFSTKRIDALTGLSYYGYRFYSTELDRWTIRDPLGEAGGVNLYAFVGNNPVNWVDPWGLSGIAIGSKQQLAAEAAALLEAAKALLGTGITVSGSALTAAGAGGIAILIPRTAEAPGLPPMQSRAKDLPTRGKPNSEGVKDYGDGTGQIRVYGPDGKAQTDYDFGHDHGAGDPHAHDWDWKATPPRQPGRCLKPGE